MNEWSPLPPEDERECDEPGTPPQTGEPAPLPCVTEIVLTCSTQILAGMVAAYETAIEQAAGDLPLLILWWGRSRKRGSGTIVLEWLGKVPASFLESLDIDEEVFDYSYYEDERVSVETEEEPVTRAEQDAPCLTVQERETESPEHQRRSTYP